MYRISAPLRILDFFVVNQISIFFTLGIFLVQGESNERGNFFPSRYSLLRKKFYRHGDWNRKIKSIIHFENFKVRAYTLHCNGALLQATKPTKNNRSL